MSKTQLNFDVPTDVKRQLKALAALHGQTMEQVANRALMAEISRLQRSVVDEREAIAS